MKKFERSHYAPEVIWHQEASTLTLEGEPVLKYSLSWPEVTGAGPGGCWISRYYARLAKSWRLRWRREMYWRACLSLAGQRAASRPFTPWSCRLAGEVALWQDDLLSLRLEGEEIRGDGKASRVRWGDVWKVKDGAPCPPGELFAQKRGWRRYVLNQIRAQGGARQAAGDLVLDPDWKVRVKRALPTHGLCLTEAGVEAAFPQCTIAPAAEGTPIFVIPRNNRPQPPEKTTDAAPLPAET